MTFFKLGYVLKYHRHWEELLIDRPATLPCLTNAFRVQAGAVPS